MLHFVNQTKTDLVLKLTEDGFLCMSKADDDSKNLNVVQIDIGAQDEYDDLFIGIQSKMEENGGTFQIRGNRASKLYVSVPDIAVLYSEKYATKSLIHMFAKETGLKANEYYYPKSAIFVITDTDYDVDVEFPRDSDVLNLSTDGDSTAVPIFRAVSKDQSVEGLTITVFLCNLTKWDKMPDETFIKISDELKLRVSTIKKTNNTTGAKYSINALIRCDKDGKEIQLHKKDAAGRHSGGGRSQEGNFKHKNGKKNNNNRKGGGRTRLSEVMKDLQTVHNG